jgi:hypothetical protein
VVWRRLPVVHFTKKSMEAIAVDPDLHLGASLVYLLPSPPMPSTRPQVVIDGTSPLPP